MTGQRRLWHVAVLALALLALPVAAQDVTGPLRPNLSILTIDQDRFFAESRIGREILQRERDETAALEAENVRIEQELIAEEQSLTEQRKTLPSEEFAKLASAFDAKVERIRSEQDAKARNLTQNRDAEREKFLRVAVPVLGELMKDKGAVAIIDKSAIIISLTEADITDEAIARVDQASAPTGTDGTPPASP